eukprot:jgi/Mesen1/10598/ME000086S10137
MVRGGRGASGKASSETMELPLTPQALHEKEKWLQEAETRLWEVAEHEASTGCKENAERLRVMATNLSRQKLMVHHVKEVLKGNEQPANLVAKKRRRQLAAQEHAQREGGGGEEEAAAKGDWQPLSRAHASSAYASSSRAIAKSAGGSSALAAAIGAAISLDDGLPPLISRDDSLEPLLARTDDVAGTDVADTADMAAHARAGTTTHNRSSHSDDHNYIQTLGGRRSGIWKGGQVERREESMREGCHLKEVLPGSRHQGSNQKGGSESGSRSNSGSGSGSCNDGLREREREKYSHGRHDGGARGGEESCGGARTSPASWVGEEQEGGRKGVAKGEGRVEEREGQGEGRLKKAGRVGSNGNSDDGVRVGGDAAAGEGDRLRERARVGGKTAQGERDGGKGQERESGVEREGEREREREQKERREGQEEQREEEAEVEELDEGEMFSSGGYYARMIARKKKVTPEQWAAYREQRTPQYCRPLSSAAVALGGRADGRASGAKGEGKAGRVGKGEGLAQRSFDWDDYGGDAREKGGRGDGRKGGGAACRCTIL